MSENVKERPLGRPLETPPMTWTPTQGTRESRDERRSPDVGGVRCLLTYRRVDTCL